MSANLALAGQGYADQIVKQAGAMKEGKTTNPISPVRKPDLENIFGAHKPEPKEAVLFPKEIQKVIEPIAAQQSVSIFSDPVAQSQHEAAKVAYQADSQNYDAGKISARFGGIA